MTRQSTTKMAVQTTGIAVLQRTTKMTLQTTASMGLQSTIKMAVKSTTSMPVQSTSPLPLCGVGAPGHNHHTSQGRGLHSSRRQHV